MSAGYALGKLARELQRSPQDTRMTRNEFESKRQKKAEQWLAVFEGMLRGALDVGSRRPTKFPEWVTLEVLDGGFASGNALATIGARERPNRDFLTLRGGRELAAMLDSGRFRVEFPEHVALMAVVWLLRNDHVAEAEQVLKEIVPYFGEIRFYPAPSDSVIEVSPVVSVVDVGTLKATLRDSLDALRNRNFKRMRKLLSFRESLTVWLPLKWEIVALFAETVECAHPPEYVTNSDGCILDVNGNPISTSKGKPQYVSHPSCPAHECHSCGFPFRRIPSDFKARACALHAKALELDAADKEEGKKWSRRKRFQCDAWGNEPLGFGQSSTVCEPVLLCRKMRTKRSFAKLLRILEVCATQGPEALTGRNVGLCRALLAGFNTKRGLPGSERFENWRGYVLKAVGEGSEKSISLLLACLDGYNEAKGLKEEELAEVSKKCSDTRMPKRLLEQLNSTRLGTLEELLKERLVPSAEVVAQLVPALASVTTSAGIEDPALRRLDYALRVSFHRRRSLLLLNLEHQVKLEDLPWAGPLRARCVRGDVEKLAAFRTLKTVVAQVLKHFPHTILPNKLLQCLRELAKAADVSVFLTDEIAADIFMGEFSSKYCRATEQAASAMVGSVYSRYYGLEKLYGSILEGTQRRVPYTSERMICDCRAFSADQRGSGDPEWGYGWIAANGCTIEWQQIFTTHNLAGLYFCLGLHDEVDWRSLVMRVWSWVLKALENCPTDSRKHKLQRLKNIAYAWRQLVFFLSMLRDKEAAEVMISLERSLSENIRSPGARIRILEHFLTPLSGTVRNRLTPLRPVTGWTAGGDFSLEPVVDAIARNLETSGTN